MKKLIHTFTACLIFTTAIANAAMTGEMRDVFIESAYTSCYQNQRAASVNLSISNITLQQYCKCFVTYLADSLNNQLAMGITEGNAKISNISMEIATNYCMKNYCKYRLNYWKSVN